MSIFTAIGHFFSNLFKSVKNDADKIAVAITEGVQAALKSGVLTDIAKVIEGIFPGVQHLPEEIVAKMQDITPKILVAELAIQGLPDNPTEEDFLAFEKRVLDAFNVKDDKSKLWSTFSAQVYGLLKTFVGLPKKSFADDVALVEAAFQKLRADEAAIADGSLPA